MNDALGGLEVMPGDEFLGVSLQRYLPLGPTEGRLRASALLNATLPSDGPPRTWFEATITVIGRGRSVWRVHWIGGRLRWESYFWRHATDPPGMALADVAAAAGRTPDPSVLRFIESSATTALCMSVELDPGDTEKLLAVDAYLELAPNTAAYYRASSDGIRLRGVQSRFEQTTQWDRFETALRASPRLGGVSPKDLVPSPLRTDRWIYLTHGSETDGVYVTGLDLSALRWFLGWSKAPVSLDNWIGRHADRLDHLAYDVGYRVNLEGPEVVVEAGSIYASL